MDDMRSRSWILVSFVLGATLMVSHGAVAQQTPGASSSGSVEGVIVEVREDELIVDLGTADGLPSDATVEVFRRLEVTHPVTDKTVSDRFPIGRISLARVGTKLSIVTEWKSLQRAPSVGDYVVWQKSSSASSDQSASASTDQTGSESSSETDGQTDVQTYESDAPERSPARKALESTFRRSLGQPLDERISLWERYLEDYPDSKFAGQVTDELTWLRKRLEAIRKAKKSDTEADSDASDEGSPTIEGNAFGPSKVRVDDSLVLTAVVDKPPRVERVRALVRRAGSETYETIPMTRAGDHNWRIELGEKWRKPGRLEYLVEAVSTDGQTHLLEGSTSAPQKISVVEPVEDPATKSGRSQASSVFEYVDFHAGEGTDQFLRFEADYRYELNFDIIEAFSVGTGIFNGTGASVDEVEAGKPSRDITVTYGYAEMEFQFDELFAISTRVLAGDHTSERRQTLQSAWGARLRLRMGKKDATRLIVGGALTDQIGNEAWITFATEPFKRVPMRGEALVTNLPVGSDLGVSLNYGLGYRLADWVTVSARVGWNARKIDYQGPSVGVSTQLDW